MRRISLVVALATLGAVACGNPPGRGDMDIPSELAARAEITPEEAREAAFALVPSGELVSGELEEEDGQLLYSFDIRVAGISGVDEVHIDAHTGAVLSHEHESADDEASER